MSPEKNRRRSINATVIAAVIGAAGVFGAAILTNWGQIFNCHAVTPHDELTCVRQISDVMNKDQAANALYADFLRNTDRQTRFSDYFRIWKQFGSTKQELLDRMKKIRPTPRYSRLCEILSEGLQSDILLASLEEKSLQHTLNGVMQMDSLFPKQKKQNNAKLSKQEERRQALETLNRFRTMTKKWLDESREINASLQSARVTSITAVRLLNEEVGKLGLPYKLENPFIEKKTSADTAAMEQNRRR